MKLAHESARNATSMKPRWGVVLGLGAMLVGCGADGEGVMVRSGIYQLEIEAISDDCDSMLRVGDGGRHALWGGTTEDGRIGVSFASVRLDGAGFARQSIDVEAGASLHSVEDYRSLESSGVECHAVRNQATTVAAIDTDYLELEHEVRWEIPEERLDCDMVQHVPQVSCTTVVRHVFTLVEECPSDCLRSMGGLGDVECACD